MTVIQKIFALNVLKSWFIWAYYNTLMAVVNRPKIFVGLKSLKLLILDIPNCNKNICRNVASPCEHDYHLHLGIKLAPICTFVYLSNQYMIFFQRIFPLLFFAQTGLAVLYHTYGWSKQTRYQVHKLLFVSSP